MKYTIVIEQTPNNYAAIEVNLIRLGFGAGE